MQQVLIAFGTREQALRDREARLEDRMKALEIAEAVVDRKLAELVGAENNLRATLAMAEGASESDLSRLTEVYQKMKPKDAAALFEEMAPDFAAGFLARMHPDSAAAILAGLSPASAYGISVVLAGRHMSVPTE